MDNQKWVNLFNVERRKGKYSSVKGKSADNYRTQTQNYQRNIMNGMQYKYVNTYILRKGLM